MIPLLRYFCLFFLFFCKFNTASAASYSIGSESRNVSTLNNNDSVTFNSDSSILIIDDDKILSSISTTQDSGAGTINFNSVGKSLTVNNSTNSSIGSSSKVTKEIIFNQDATLNIKDDIYTAKITSAGDFGTINLHGVEAQDLSAIVGNATNRIKNINVSNSSATGARFNENVFVKNLTISTNVNISTDKTTDISGNLTGTGRIKGSSTGKGTINLSGSEQQIVTLAIGQSPTVKLGEVMINNKSEEGVIFTNNIFVNKFNVNSKTTIIGNGSYDLGVVSVAKNKELIFLSNNISINSLENSGIINIPSGKVLTISNETTLSGKFKIGVDYNSSNNAIAGQINAINNVNINNNLELFFDFSNPDQNEDKNLYPFLTVDSGKKLTIADLSAIRVEDNSTLMNVSLKLDSTGNQILIFNGVDKTTLDNLDIKDSKIAQKIMNIDSKADGNIKLIQTQLRKISNLQTLKKSLKTLNTPANNMIGSTSSQISHRSDNVIISHILAEGSSINSGFSSGNNINEKYIWGQAFEGEASQDSREGQDGYDSNIVGLVFGSDFKIDSDKADYLFGLAASYVKADIDTNSGVRSDVNSFGLSLYNLNNFVSGFYNDNILSLAYNKYNQRRQIEVGTFKTEAKSDFYGQQYGIRSGVGYNYKVTDFFIISPNTSIKYSRLDQSNYEEEGAGDAGLKVTNKPFNNLSSEVGNKFSYHHILDKNYTAMPVLNLSWIRNLKTKGQESTSSFIAGGDEISNKGASLAENIFNIGFQMSLMQTKENTNLTFKYEIQKGSGFKSETSYLKYLMPF